MNPKSKKRIWILEDEPGARFVYKSILEERYDIVFFEELPLFKAAMAEKKSKKFDLVIVDLQIKDESFLNFLKSDTGTELMEDINFIVVSCLDEVDAIQTSFSMGAIDYITKPFGKKELVYKIDRIFQSKERYLYQSDNFALDSIKFRVLKGELVSDELTSKEFKIISLIANSPQKRVTRNTIQKEVWDNAIVSKKSLDVHIYHLRQKILPLGLELIYNSPNYIVI